MRAVIVEDEVLVAKDLQKKLSQLTPEVEVAAVLHSLEEANEWLNSHPQPELLFLDIQLSDGVSFQLFEGRSLTCPVIFTTAYDQYALKAFEVNSIDYLLKPVDRDALQRALHKLQTRLPAEVELQQNRMNTLLNLMQEHLHPTYRTRHMVHYRNQHQVVTEEQLAAIGRDELIYLYTRQGEKFVTRYDTLEEVERHLNPRTHFRANRQFIIHIEAIQGYKSSLNGKLQLRLQGHAALEIIVSREKAAAFKEWFEGS